ncbi:MAG: 4Fe-4S binding protein [Thermodesulfobacteriota bacterium]
MGFTNGVGKTGYSAVIDPERREDRGDSFDTGNVNAIGPPEGVRFPSKEDRCATVREETCMGCGACVSACSKGALVLVFVDDG